MLDKLGSGVTLQIPLEMFYLFFSGGAIGGDQSIDIDQARRIREQIPHLSVFGGGVGNMLLPGKLAVGEGLPVCRELAHIIPQEVPGNRKLSWRQMTTEISYSRKDDAKDDLLRPYLQSDDTPKLTGGQAALMLDSGDEKKEKKKDRPEQMRYMIEVLCRGSVLWQETVFQDMTEIELGAFVAAIVEWSKQPYIGGQARIGMGKVKVDMQIELFGEGKEPFLSVADGKCFLAESAKDAKVKYDEFLNRYAGYLEEKRDSLIRAIGG
ncbi:MAG: hypothetical protein JRI54_00275 [Deltaproteobacteria bacterium]|nr:hypothetical protein [Deltaproteobacteria bacterium]